MSKAIIVSLFGVVSAATFALSEYVSPAAPSLGDVPPVIVDIPVETVASKLQALNAQKYISLFDNKAQPLPNFIQSATSKIDGNKVRYSLTLGSDLVILVDAMITATEGNATMIDIVAHMPHNRFSTHSGLHPYDIKVLESIADLLVTDYVDSVLKRKRMANEKELETEFIKRTGFSEQQAKAFGARVELAFRESYGTDFDLALANQKNSRLQQSEASSSWYSESGEHRFGDPTLRPKPSSNPVALHYGDGEAAGAEAAAEGAGYEAFTVGTRAARAAEEAGRAADAAGRAAEAMAAGAR